MEDDDRRTVLVVDDNDDIRSVFSLILESSGYRAIEAENGREGVELARRERPDAILMDLAMPVLDGWGAMRLLKADQRTAHIPIVAVSAFDLAEHRRRARRAGCSAFVAKPAPPAAVLAAVDRLVPA